MWLVWLISSFAMGDWQAKVAPEVLGDPREFVLILEDQADLGLAKQKRGKSARGSFAVQRLQSTAASSQATVRADLDAMKLSYRSFWIVNMIHVWGADGDALANLAQRRDVKQIVGNPSMSLNVPTPQTTKNAPSGVEWNLTWVGAEDVWAMGYRGQGVVVAGQDTGYQWSNSYLGHRYRGNLGDEVSHDYNWHDAIHSGGGICGPDSAQPCDDHGHGTHTMGTILGSQSGDSIGMAPEAVWMACRNMDQGNGTPVTYAECFEFFVAPTDANGENPDPSKAPHVINNSWTCPASEGCGDPTILQMVVENTRAAGIVVVVSAGNAGPGCSTIADPTPIYDASLTVGATDSADLLANFSSRGPVLSDGSQRMKPDVSAPGVAIRSCLPNGVTASWNGTSMAAPHVTGLVALMISANPALAGDVESIEHLIWESAVPLTTTSECSGLSGSQVPNPFFGHGRIDAMKAVELALAHGNPEFDRNAVDSEHNNFLFHNYAVNMASSDALALVGPPSTLGSYVLTAYDLQGRILAHGSLTDDDLENLGYSFWWVSDLLEAIGLVGQNTNLTLKVSRDAPVEAVQVAVDKGLISAQRTANRLSQALQVPHIAANDQWNTEMAFFHQGSVADAELVTPSAILPIKDFQQPESTSVQNAKTVFGAASEITKNASIEVDASALAGSFSFHLTPEFGASAGAQSQTVDVHSRRQWVGHVTPIDSNQWFTGIAVSNPNDQPLDVQIQPLGATAVDPLVWSLEPFGHQAMATGEMNLAADVTHLQLSAAQSFAVTHLFGTLNWQELCALPAMAEPGWWFATAPPTPLIYTLPLLRDLALDHQYFSFFLTNPGTQTVDATIIGVSASGASETVQWSWLPGEKRIGTEILAQNQLSNGEDVVVYQVQADGPLISALLLGSHETGLLAACEGLETGALRELQVQLELGSDANLRVRGWLNEGVESLAVGRDGAWRTLTTDSGSRWVDQAWPITQDEVAQQVDLRIQTQSGSEYLLRPNW